MDNKEEGKDSGEKAPQEKSTRKKAQHAPPPPKKPWRSAVFSFDKKTKSDDLLHEEGEEQRAEDVEKGLEAIYLSDNNDDDLGVIKHKKRRFWVKVIVALFAGMLLLSMAVWAGLYFIDPYATDVGGGLEVTIEGDEAVTLGKQEAIEVHWKNLSRQPIRNVEVRLSFPAEFTPTDFVPKPTNEDSLIWNLGVLSPDESGTIIVHGVFLGHLGDQAAIQALGTYQSSDEKEDEKLVTSLAIRYEKTILETAFDIPPKLVSGENFKFDYVIRNVSADDLTGMEARFEFPANFSPSASGTAFAPVEGRTGMWTLPIDALLANTTSTIPFRGVFSAGASGEYAFKASVGRETELGDFLAIAETETSVPLLSGDLGIQFVINGSNEDRMIAPGETLNLAIGYENLSPEVLKEISLKLRLETVLNGEVSTEGFVSWGDLEDGNGGVTSTEGGARSILFDKEAIPSFEALSPHQTNSLDLSVPTLPARNDARDVVIRVSVEGHIGSVGEDEVNRTVQAKPIELRYRSDADISVEARYFLEEGAPIGSGPLPPVAGETTKYRVYWVIDKHIHELENVTLETSLPNIAAWTNRTLAEAGEFRYDAAERKVVWELNKIPHDIERLEAWFEVDITPAEVDIGRFASVLNESHFMASDADVGEEIQKSKPPITTDLQNDEGARGKGVVRSSE